MLTYCRSYAHLTFRWSRRCRKQLKTSHFCSKEKHLKLQCVLSYDCRDATLLRAISLVLHPSVVFEEFFLTLYELAGLQREWLGSLKRKLSEYPETQAIQVAWKTYPSIFSRRDKFLMPRWSSFIITLVLFLEPFPTIKSTSLCLYGSQLIHLTWRSSSQYQI